MIPNSTFWIIGCMLRTLNSNFGFSTRTLEFSTQPWSSQLEAVDSQLEAGNVDFMMRAVARDWQYLKYAAGPVRRNRAVVLRAIESDAQALHEVLPVELRRSRFFLLEAVARNPEVYRVVVEETY